MFGENFLDLLVVGGDEFLQDPASFLHIGSALGDVVRNWALLIQRLALVKELCKGLGRHGDWRTEVNVTLISWIERCECGMG